MNLEVYNSAKGKATVFLLKCGGVEDDPLIGKFWVVVRVGRFYDKRIIFNGKAKVLKIIDEQGVSMTAVGQTSLIYRNQLFEQYGMIKLHKFIYSLEYNNEHNEVHTYYVKTKSLMRQIERKSQIANLLLNRNAPPSLMDLCRMQLSTSEMTLFRKITSDGLLEY